MKKKNPKKKHVFAFKYTGIVGLYSLDFTHYCYGHLFGLLETKNISDLKNLQTYSKELKTWSNLGF